MLAFAGGCATPPLDRYLLQSDDEVRIRGADGMLTPERSKAILEALKARSPSSDVLGRHIAVEEALAGNPLSAGNKVTLLEDGPRTFTDMLAVIKGAKRSIHVETYIFEDDEVGRQFAAALLERARAGVKVRLLYDAVGSAKTPPEFFKSLADGGIDVGAFNPLGPEILLKGGPFEFNHRDHRKLTLIDGRVAYVGGINISAVYGPLGSQPAARAERDPPFEKRPWRDTEARIEGPVVADLQRAFFKQWARAKKDPPDMKESFPALAPQGNTLVRAIEGAPSRDGVNILYVALISAIEHAETQVRITNAYFVPHRELLAALEGAARRGVDVRLILPSRTDSWLTFHAGRSYYEELLDSGVRIFERRNRLLHAKTATVDGVWSTVGSTNLDWRSLADNDELNAVVLGPEFAAQLDAVFDKDLADSAEITRQAWHDRSLPDRLKEAAARAWARLL